MLRLSDKKERKPGCDRAPWYQGQITDTRPIQSLRDAVLRVLYSPKAMRLRWAAKADRRVASDPTLQERAAQWHRDTPAKFADLVDVMQIPTPRKRSA